MALIPKSDMEHDATLAAAYRAGAHEEPPAHLDAAIRAAARREVGAGPRRVSPLHAWRMPVSLAAVVMLSVTVVLMVREEGGDQLESAPPAVSTRAEPAPAAPPPPAMQQRAPQQPALPQSIAREPVPPQPSALGSPSAQQHPADLSASAAPAAPARQSMATVPPEAEQRALAGAASAKVRDDVAVNPRLEAAPPSESARPILRSAPAPMAAEALSAPAARKAAPAAAMLAPPPAQQALWQDLLTEPAEKWLERIVDWRRSGRTVDADALAAEFRRRFPDRSLPDEGR